MASAQLHHVARHLQGLRESQTVREAPDAELLERFTVRREESAFAALLHRHGPMVLGVSRRVLHSDADADDVFQATFLLLAKKAASIRKREAVGSWLHGVARRLAVRAKAQGVRRVVHERRAAYMGAIRQTETADQDLCAALDAALDELPERYRAPLVLCYLEGRSHAEAARQLGRPLTTVRTHIARGRQRLRSRLARHGLTLSAAGLASLLLASAAPAAAPAALSRATLKAALALVAGGTAAALCSTRVAGLVEGGLRTMLPTKAKIVTSLLLVLGLVAGAAALADPAGRRTPSSASQADAKPQAAPKDDQESVTYAGRVLGPDGKPVAGAGLYLTQPWHYITRPAPSPRYAATADDGTFRFTVPKALFADGVADLVASAKGFGPAWLGLGPKDRRENLALQLVKDDVPIQGRVADLQGKPVSGATVRVLEIDAAPKEDLGPWLQALKSSKGNSIHLQHQHLTQRLIVPEVPGLPQQVTSDEDGKFRLTGFGRDRLVTLRVDGPGIASHELLVLTRPGKAIEAPEVTAQPDYGIEGLTVRYHPADFKHIAGPTKPVVGVVRDRDTGKPIAGAKVKSYKLANNPIHGLDFLETKTDAQGRYRLAGLPKGKGNKILIEPPADLPYLPVHAEVPDTFGLDAVAVNFDLKRGVWIEGQVTDKVTRKPVPCRVEYYAMLGNPNLRDYPGYSGTFVNRPNFNADGRFRVLGLPGPGLLAVWAGEQYLEALERDDAEGVKTPHLGTDPVHIMAFGHNALARLDPPKDAESFRRDVVLDPGETFTGTLIGPDGKPVAGARSYGLTSQAGWERPPLQTAEFTIRAFNPRRPRPVLFRHLEKGLVGAFRYPEDKGKLVEVRLQAGATVTGRLVDADGRPRANAVLNVSLHGPAVLPGYSGPDFSLSDEVRTDADGRFRVPALLPGRQYRLSDRAGYQAFGDGLRSGETKDLGDVRMKQPGEAGGPAGIEQVVPSP